jgi:hypothetical protein
MSYVTSPYAPHARREAINLVLRNRILAQRRLRAEQVSIDPLSIGGYGKLDN